LPKVTIGEDAARACFDHDKRCWRFPGGGAAQGVASATDDYRCRPGRHSDQLFVL